ncbi:hypothetical protein WICANDRAFT_77611 [Wickerhamomyces anomalus NRRL Y-366-8]|uniref:Amino acid permease/ SLC12A domain-containing protein n=1 Tax=Wickerhamomyces anomalus (strain ATCC 58044 / CBS 1984 / NCYC 433 / NRRL Y-366-8) TaxID=683960 RepID=A0A1E3P6A4_WICAA|nr:uncharacterized protein WICANDRAFT_77611 [Wickerhamomyces anomalus NRRL Y-366-8]ODQ60946.1 hypothetical protein WICANDRAFT_77611 [Wickerhamomyces anomalus NRRL Y-366-8]
MSSSKDLLKDSITTVEVNSRSNSDASEDQLLSPIHSQRSYGSLHKELLNDSVLQIDLEDLPHGRHLGLYSTIILFISRIIGSGIWATPSNVFAGVGGNPFLFFTMWLIAALMAFAGLYAYLELGSIVPRSGGTKVFLEFIYPRPKLLISVVFSLFTLAFGISLTNSIVFGKYTLFSLGYSSEFIDSSNWSNYIGLILIIVTTLIHGFSTKHGVFVQNVLGAMKLFLVAIMSLTGIYVLFFPEKLTGLPNHLDMDKFFKFDDSSIVTASSVSSSLLGCFFTFGGWNAVHTVSSEIKDPVRTLKIAGPVSLLIAFFNFILINIAYLKVIPHDEVIKAGPLIGSILFERVLGYRLGRQFLTISIALSSASNVFVVVYSISRMNQEIFREGYLPFSSIFASNFRHTNTPLWSLLVCSVLTSFWLILLPANGKSFNYIVSLEGYSTQVFLLLIAIGIFIIRKKYPDQKAPIRASITGTALIVVVSLSVLISPFFSKNDSSNPTYISYLPPYYIASPFLLSLGLAFWAIKFKILPYLGSFKYHREIETLDDGLTVKKWVKVHY